jgi:hypothetical protein
LDPLIKRPFPASFHLSHRAPSGEDIAPPARPG